MHRILNRTRLFIVFVALAFFVSMNTVLAQGTYGPPAPSGIRFGLDEAAQDTGVIRDDIPHVFGTIILNVLSIVGVIFLILIIYGGVTWMTSGGNEQRISMAKKVLTSSVIGLTIVMAGYSITYFIVQNLTTATQEVPVQAPGPS